MHPSSRHHHRPQRKDTLGGGDSAKIRQCGVSAYPRPAHTLTLLAWPPKLNAAKKPSARRDGLPHIHPVTQEGGHSRCPQAKRFRYILGSSNLHFLMEHRGEYGF